MSNTRALGALLVVALLFYLLNSNNLSFLPDTMFFGMFCFLIFKQTQLKEKFDTYVANQKTIQIVSPEQLQQMVKDAADIIVDRKMN